MPLTKELDAVWCEVFLPRAFAYHSHQFHSFFPSQEVQNESEGSFLTEECSEFKLKGKIGYDLPVSLCLG